MEQIRETEKSIRKLKKAIGNLNLDRKVCDRSRNSLLMSRIPSIDTEIQRSQKTMEHLENQLIILQQQADDWAKTFHCSNDRIGKDLSVADQLQQSAEVLIAENTDQTTMTGAVIAESRIPHQEIINR